MQNLEKLPPNLVRFYAAELVNMLEFLRNHQIAHRDLKPENILITKDYHFKLVIIMLLFIIQQY